MLLKRKLYEEKQNLRRKDSYFISKSLLFYIGKKKVVYLLKRNLILFEKGPIAA